MHGLSFVLSHFQSFHNITLCSSNIIKDKLVALVFLLNNGKLEYQEQYVDTSYYAYLQTINIANGCGCEFDKMEAKRLIDAGRLSLVVSDFKTLEPEEILIKSPESDYGNALCKQLLIKIEIRNKKNTYACKDVSIKICKFTEQYYEYASTLYNDFFDFIVKNPNLGYSELLYTTFVVDKSCSGSPNIIKYDFNKNAWDTMQAKQ